VYEVAKRTFDLIVAALAVVLLAPLMLVIAALIKLTSPGDVLYRGVRTGRYGRPFRILKFRTMVPDAERAGTTTVLGDPRVTRVGRWLRRVKLDELPQLFNVLRGEMSLVGPRPEVAEHTDVYDTEERTILDVRPGITDFASIELVRLDEVLGVDNPHEVYVTRVRHLKNQMRLRYVRERSFMTDMRIIARTVRAVASKVRD